MGRKNVVYSYKMFDAADISTNQTSSTTNVLHLDQASIHIEWAGTSPVGEITVQAQNGDSDTWYDLDLGSTISISGNTGDHQIIFSEMPFTSIRLQYASTSGIGELTATISMKVLGA